MAALLTPRFLCPDTGQDVAHRVVAFVAGVFVDQLVDSSARARRRSRARPRGRIFSTVNWSEQRIASSACEALLETHRCAGAAEGRLAQEVVVLTTRVRPSQRPRESPTYGRMAGGTCGRPSTGTTRGFVHHLHDEDHVSRALHDLDAVVVGPGDERGAGVQADDAAIDERTRLRRVGAHGAKLFVASLGIQRLEPAPGLRRQRWNAPVRWIDRRATCASIPRSCCLARTRTRCRARPSGRSLRPPFLESIRSRF